MNPKNPHDRFFCPPAAIMAPCGRCKHRYPPHHADLKCDAYPDGVPFHVVEEKTLNSASLIDPCNPGKNIRFEPID